MYKCDICNECYSSYNGLSSHKRLKHYGLKNQKMKRSLVIKKCEKCGKDFEVERRFYEDGTFYVNKKEKDFVLDLVLIIEVLQKSKIVKKERKEV